MADFYAARAGTNAGAPLDGFLTAVHNRRIMVEAQRWLLYSSTPIGQIADALGFRDAGYFSRFFTKRLGISPRSLRAD